MVGRSQIKMTLLCSLPSQTTAHLRRMERTGCFLDLAWATTASGTFLRERRKGVV